MKPRSAVSLLELLLIMSACTVVLTLTGVLLQRAMRIQMQSRATAASERTALRLANQFRRDVHKANAIKVHERVQKQGAFVQLELAGGQTVEYYRHANIVSRQESGNDKPLWREEFVLPAVSELTVDEGTAPQRLILTIAVKVGAPLTVGDKPLASPIAAPLSLHVEAVVGSDLRFRTARAAQEVPE